jgi:hypothetical protein
MAHRAVIAASFSFFIACGGSVEHVPAPVTQGQQAAEDDTAAATTSTTTSTSSTASADAPDAMPSSKDGAPMPPHPYGGECGACFDEHWVCCPAGEPCAGKCVPDCRMAPEKCPDRTTCDDATGVCLRR